jgi:hypothetical protein
MMKHSFSSQILLLSYLGYVSYKKLTCIADKSGRLLIDCIQDISIKGNESK